jgi:hypothetical protein
MIGPNFDTDTIYRTLNLLFAPGQVVELRALNVPTGPGRYVIPTMFGYFNDWEALVLAACDMSEKGASGVYVTLNPVNPLFINRVANRVKQAGKDEATKDEDIVRRRLMLVDCDAERVARISATDAEHDAAIAKARKIRAWLRRRGWPEPLFADSGNGGHLIYRVNLPRDDDGKVERVLKALAAHFDDDVVKVDQKVFNPSRITKLYGTAVRKGDDTEDRPHRLARLIEEGNNAESRTRGAARQARRRGATGARQHQAEHGR